MGTTGQSTTDEKLDGRQRPSSMIRKWAFLLLGFFLIGIFMFVIAPWIREMPAVKPIADLIDERDLDAGALFYTEIEETSEAEVHLRGVMKSYSREKARHKKGSSDPRETE